MFRGWKGALLECERKKRDNFEMNQGILFGTGEQNVVDMVYDI